ncbi:glycosyltransferase family 2 protein [bacterium]|nr:glycosyltransferase family 2 protein [bacterium]
MDKREKISAFIITFNEERYLEACIQSVSFCDEIIVIDSFSQDRTVEIAKQLGAKVFTRAWPGYRAQKAFGLEQCENEWVLNIDADERVTPELKENILSALSQAKSKNINGYYMNRVVFFLDRWWRRGGWYPEYRLRLLRKSKTTWGGTDPHEKPIVEGQTETLGGELEHYTYKNIEDQFSRLNKHSTDAAREEYQLGGRASLFSLIVNPLVRFFKFYVIKRGFSEGKAGFIVALAEAYYTFMKYAKVWEHEFNERKKRS